MTCISDVYVLRGSSLNQKGTLFTHLLLLRTWHGSLFYTLGVSLMNNTMREHQVLLGELLTKKTVSFTQFLFMICPNDRSMSHAPFVKSLLLSWRLKKVHVPLFGWSLSIYATKESFPPPQLRMPLWKTVHKNDSWWYFQDLNLKHLRSFNVTLSLKKLM